MNCRDVHIHIEEREAAFELSWDIEIAQHISGCECCRRFLEIRKDMSTGLCLLRGAAPSVSKSLDTSVIANYREAMAARQVISTRPRWISSTGYWRLGVATAAALVAIAAVLAVRRPQVPVEHNHATVPTIAVAPASPREPVKLSLPAPRAKKNIYVAKVGTTKPRASDSEHPPAAPAAFKADDSQEFRSLMYCDELSCDGGMNVVRVQLPALPSGFLPTARMEARPVSADVLVGADGFARGIRIVH